jgi:biotin transport system substrate-specific component
MNSTTLIKKIALVALFAALICAATFISIPLSAFVPFALQNFFALLAGMVLGPWGAVSVLLYLGAGAIGLPVFAGAVGGFVHFASSSGGYLPGYALCALVAGLIMGVPRSEGRLCFGIRAALWRRIAAAVAGMLVVYLPGLLWLQHVLHTDLATTLAYGLWPFLIGDGIKAAIAFLIANRLRMAAARFI